MCANPGSHGRKSNARGETGLMKRMSSIVHPGPVAKAISISAPATPVIRSTAGPDWRVVAEIENPRTSRKNAAARSRSENVNPVWFILVMQHFGMRPPRNRSPELPVSCPRPSPLSLTHRCLWPATAPLHRLGKELQRATIGLFRCRRVEVVAAGKSEGVASPLINMCGHALIRAQGIKDAAARVLAAQLV